MSNRVATLNVTEVPSIQVMYNTTYKEFDGVLFLDCNGLKLGVAYFRDTIPCGDPEVQKPSIEIDQILVAGVFTADLDFLAKFLGHQGASATWLCVFCLAMHAQLKITFTSAGA